MRCGGIAEDCGDHVLSNVGDVVDGFSCSFLGVLKGCVKHGQRMCLNRSCSDMLCLGRMCSILYSTILVLCCRCVDICS